MGAVISETLAAAGCNVALTYRHNRARAEEVAQRIGQRGQSATLHALDIGDEASVAAAVAEVAAQGRIHTVVLANGTDIQQPLIRHLPPSVWREVVDADVHGFFHVLHHTLPHLKAGGGGSYVHLSSAGLERWAKGDALSIAPKACIDALLRGVAREEGHHNVRANAVNVGVIESGMFLRLWEQGVFDDTWRQAVLKNLCIKRLGQAQDVADAVLYLATAQYVTGQTISVSGGYGV